MPCAGQFAAAEPAPQKPAPMPPVIVEKPALSPKTAPSDTAPAAVKPAARTGVKIELKVPQFPAVLPPKGEPKPPATWTAEEVAGAKAQCAAILKRIHAVAIPEAPLREGDCGTPAPIQLISIGKNPEIALSPPATVTCSLAEALYDWMNTDIQPLARSELGGNVIKIEVMSSYSCRAAYGRKGNKWSEHAMANALDIRGFVTAAGKTAYVLEDWGTPKREIIARINAEKAKAAKALAEQQAAEKAAQAAQVEMSGKQQPGKSGVPAQAPPAASASTAGAPAGGVATSSVSSGTPRLTVTLPGGATRPTDEVDGLSLAPSRLGGPKTQIPEPERKQNFLHAAHASACRVFGTTLGPEANAAHRNHLHVDMAQRKGDLKICD